MFNLARIAAVLVLSFALGLFPLAAVGQTTTPPPYVWHNVRIVAGGFITGIEAHPWLPELFYVRTDIGGTYRWDPLHQHWIPLTDWVTPDNWNLEGTASIALDPTDPQKLYLAQGAYVESWAPNAAIFKSSDQGRTFTVINLPFQLGSNENGRFSGERLAVVPWSPNVLYLGTNVNGLWQSTDYGNTWAQVASFPITGPTNNDKAGVIFVMFGPKLKGASYPTIYVGVSDPTTGLYQSTDNGESWQAVPGQPTGDVPTNAAISLNGNLYLTYSNQAGPNGAGNGQVWKYAIRQNVWTNITPADPITSSQNYGYAKVVVDPWNPNTVMVSTLDRYYPGDEIWRTRNAGTTWEALGNEIGAPPHSSFDVSLSPWLLFGGTTPGDNMGNWIGAMMVDPWAPNHLRYGTGQTLWSTDQVNRADSGGVIPWRVGALGIEETAVQDLISPPAGAHLLSALGDIGGFRHDNFNVSPPQGQFYVPPLTTNTSIDFAQNNPMLIARVGWPAYAQTLCGGYSRDQGTTWTTFNNAPGCTSGPGTIAISPDGLRFVWAPTGGATVYSNDNGQNWTASAGAPANGVVASDRVNPNKFYTFDQTSGTFYVSTDGGQTFKAGATGLGTYSFKQISVVPGVEGDIWLSLQWNGLWHSTDSGMTFTPVNSVVWPDSIGFGKPAPGSTYPALYLLGRLTWSGPTFATSVFRSDDGGATWTVIADPQHQYGNLTLVIGDPRVYGRIYIGANGRGIIYGDVNNAQ
ncbi:MAG TPA: xyloglucanase [Terriglobales bacterium]|nr:xyloglucanase [Terriglobales bacterium]